MADVGKRVLAGFGTATLWFALAACSSEPAPEPNLDDLLRQRKADAPTLDATVASKDIAELERALRQPHQRLWTALGAHRVRTETATEVRRGNEPLELFKTNTAILAEGDGRYQATLHNDKEYGRDSIFDGTHLYLRPRFGSYHRRLPEKADEPRAILDDIGSWPSAQFELLAPGAAIRKSRDELVQGRAAIIVTLELASTPRPRPVEAVAQRKWRETAKTTAVSGEIALDKETGFVLSCSLDGRVEYTRDGDNFEMHITLVHEVSDIGTADKISVPAPEQTVAAPRRLGELEERESLLKGIAPPAKRGKTPDNPSGEARTADPK